MSFDLRITFTGMCLFAPDPSDDPAKRRMHVLLPALEGSDEHPDHRHYARLVYDTAYESPGATQLARRFACDPLDNAEIVLPSLAGHTPGLTLPEEIVSLDPVVGPGKLSRRFVGPDPGPELAGRVKFAAGAITSYELGHQFFLGAGESRRMTWQVEWTIRDIPGDKLVWKLQPLDASLEAPPTLPALYPIGDTIRVFVHNVTCKFLPMERYFMETNTTPAEHFEGYYRLFPGANPLIPMHDRIQWTEKAGCTCLEPEEEPEEEPEQSARHAGHDHHRGAAAHAPSAPVRSAAAGALFAPSGIGGSPVTCVVVRATLED